jgi:hypothetical protein
VTSMIWSLMVHGAVLRCTVSKPLEAHPGRHHRVLQEATCEHDHATGNRCGVLADEDAADGLQVDRAVGGNGECRGKLGFGCACGGHGPRQLGCKLVGRPSRTPTSRIFAARSWLTPSIARLEPM